MLTAYAQEMTFEIWVITLFAFFSIVFTIEVLKLLLNDLLYPENDELIMLKAIPHRKSVQQRLFVIK